MLRNPRVSSRANGDLGQCRVDMAWRLVEEMLLSLLFLRLVLQQQAQFLAQADDRTKNLVGRDIPSGKTGNSDCPCLGKIGPISADFAQDLQRLLKYMPGSPNGFHIHIGPRCSYVVFSTQLANRIGKQLHLMIDIAWGLLRSFRS